MVSAYITNFHDKTVSIIDTSNDTVSKTVTVGTDPLGVAVTPDGSKAYVVNAFDGTVSVIDVATNTVKTGTGYPITVGSVPYGVAFTPDSLKAYVTNENANTVSVIDVATDTVKTGASYPITVGINPTGVAVTPDGLKAYVANNGAGTVKVINTANDTVSTTITVGTNPLGVAITPDGSKAYVANNGAGTVKVINTADDTVSTTITVGTNPTGVAIMPDGTKAYVANAGSNTVSVIDISTNTVSKTVNVGNSPIGVAITRDSTEAYVANSADGTVSVIDTATDTVKTGAGYPITVGTDPRAFGNFIQPGSIIPMTNIYAAPQGRLTLTSLTPVMTADAINMASIYYTPYQGNFVPIYDGANIQSYTFSQLTLTLNSTNHPTSKVFDVYVSLQSGNPVLSAMYWGSNTSRSTSAGGKSGTGNASITQIDGIWVNNAAISSSDSFNGTTGYAIAQNKGTYLGTFYTTAAGQTGMAFKPTAATGGNNNILGLYNAYNRVRTVSICRDSTSSWTYGTATWRAANNSNSNRISFVDGLQQSFLEAIYQVGMEVASTNSGIGVNLDSTSATPTSFDVINGTLSNAITASCENGFSPQLGFHYVQAVENALGGTGNATFDAAGQYEYLKLSLEM